MQLSPDLDLGSSGLDPFSHRLKCRCDDVHRGAHGGQFAGGLDSAGRGENLGSRSELTTLCAQRVGHMVIEPFDRKTASAERLHLDEIGDLASEALGGLGPTRPARRRQIRSNSHFGDRRSTRGQVLATSEFPQHDRSFSEHEHEPERAHHREHRHVPHASRIDDIDRISGQDRRDIKRFHRATEPVQSLDFQRHNWPPTGPGAFTHDNREPAFDP